MDDVIYLLGTYGAYLAWRESKCPFSFWAFVAVLGWPIWIVSDYLSRRDGEPKVPAPTPEQIDKLAFELHTIGVQVPGHDTAFFHAAVHKWLEGINGK